VDETTTFSTGKLSRRAMLRASVLGLAGVAVGLNATTSRAFGAVGTPIFEAPSGVLALTIRECLVEMVDETRVYMWAFDSPQAGLRVPGPVIYATEGAPVTIDVTNTLPRDHAFEVPGVVDSGPIAPGTTVRVSFTAPPAGTYVYLDPLRAPLHRAMGLAGAMIVTPSRPAESPYTDPSRTVGNLFRDLGKRDHFPGDPWRPERSWLWVFSTVDPVAHARVRADPDLSPEIFLDEYLPTYFLLNGRSGFFSAHDPSTAIHGRIGQPALIRTVNVGLATHAPHVHGNHCYLVAEDARPCENVFALDTWRLPPMATTDVLLPYVAPPDAYPWPPSDPSVWTTDLGGDGTKGMVFPMHCHMELSQMANGGNYPHGAIAHWVITGDLADRPDDPGDPPTDPPTGPPSGGKPPKDTKPPRNPRPPKGPK
jgi:FtsP/CotA-like multicopper oxidase with cupredoxin domain